MKTVAILVSLAAVLAGVAVAETPACAITCFSTVIQQHPPLSCTEANMYLCFCKSTDLQQYFKQCLFDTCGSDASAVSAIAFGEDLCTGFGVTASIATDRPGTTSAVMESVVETSSISVVAPVTTEAAETSTASVVSSSEALVAVPSSSLEVAISVTSAFTPAITLSSVVATTSSATVPYATASSSSGILGTAASTGVAKPSASVVVAGAPVVKIGSVVAAVVVAAMAL